MNCFKPLKNAWLSHGVRIDSPGRWQWISVGNMGLNPVRILKINELYFLRLRTNVALRYRILMTYRFIWDNIIFSWPRFAPLTRRVLWKLWRQVSWPHHSFLFYIWIPVVRTVSYTGSFSRKSFMYSDWLCASELRFIHPSFPLY